MPWRVKTGKAFCGVRDLLCAGLRYEKQAELVPVWLKSMAFTNEKKESGMFLDTGFLKNDEITLVLFETMENDPERYKVPSYIFGIEDVDGEHVGLCDLRLGYNIETFYAGNIGYHIFEPYRGHRYAQKACLLLFELARKHGMDHLIITCNPDNIASKKTCAGVGGKLIEIVKLPRNNYMRRVKGDKQKCIFSIEL